MNRFVGTCLLVASLATFPAGAHEAGDIIIRSGIIHVSPNEDSDRINVAGLATLDGVEVDTDTQLGITGTYMLSNRLGIGLVGSTPFEHEIKIENTSVTAGTTKHLPPVVLLQYYFGESSDRFRPYVGLGVNTTIFFDEDVDDELNTALDTIVGVPAGTVDADLELDQSWGAAGEIGFDYQLNDRWGINGAVWYVDLSTEATVKTAAGNVDFDVDLDPIVYMLGLSYKF